MTAWSRRQVLQGLGATALLPWLPSIARADVATPRRIIWWFVPNGMPMAAWTPSETGIGAPLSPMLSPLASLADHVLVVSGLQNRAMMDYGLAASHQAATSGWLTPGGILADALTGSGRSIDQLAADALHAGAPMHSLQLGVEGANELGTCDPGYACAYNQSVSWASADTPLPQLTDPAVLFDRLFRAGRGAYAPADARARTRWRAAILDDVAASARQVASTRLSSDDRHVLSAWQDAVSDVGTTVSALADAPACPDTFESPAPGAAYETRLDAIAELLVLALQCDRTRVATLMAANGRSNHAYDFLGVSGGHHEISHHGDDPALLQSLQQIGTWHVGRLAAFLSRLQGIQTSGGSLLDHTTVVFGSGLGDGNTHSADDLPVLIAGHGAGIATGAHVVRTDEPLAALHLAVAQRSGAAVDRLGSTTSPLNLP